MAKDQYEELMNRYLTNQVTEEERIRIDAWLDMLVDNKTRKLELSDEEKEELYQRIISKQGGTESVTSYQPESLRQLHRKTWTTRIAAGIIIVMVCGFAAYRFSSKYSGQVQNTFAVSDKLEKRILEDGSIVWLQEGAQLSFEQRGNVRHVSMQGKALFEVAKKPDQPFIIEYDRINVKVYGTSFSLKTGAQVELNVLTGKVRITSDSDSTGLMVVKDEQVTYTDKNGFQKVSLTTQEAQRIVKDSEYDMSFDDVALGTVLVRLEKKFDVKMEIENPRIKDCNTKLNLTDNSLEDSLKKIAAILNVEYKIDGSVIKLTGTGCN